MSRTSIERLCQILHAETNVFQTSNHGGREMIDPIKQVRRGSLETNKFLTYFRGYPIYYKIFSF